MLEFHRFNSRNLQDYMLQQAFQRTRSLSGKKKRLRPPNGAQNSYGTTVVNRQWLAKFAQWRTGECESVAQNDVK